MALPLSWVYSWALGHTDYCAPAPDANSFPLQSRTPPSPMLSPGQMFTKRAQRLSSGPVRCWDHFDPRVFTRFRGPWLVPLSPAVNGSEGTGGFRVPHAPRASGFWSTAPSVASALGARTLFPAHLLCARHLEPSSTFFIYSLVR